MEKLHFGILLFVVSILLGIGLLVLPNILFNEQETSSNNTQVLEKKEVPEKPSEFNRSSVVKFISEYGEVRYYNDQIGAENLVSLNVYCKPVLYTRFRQGFYIELKCQSSSAAKHGSLLSTMHGLVRKRYYIDNETIKFNPEFKPDKLTKLTDCADKLSIKKSRYHFSNNGNNISVFIDNNADHTLKNISTSLISNNSYFSDAFSIPELRPQDRKNVYNFTQANRKSSFQIKIESPNCISKATKEIHIEK